MGGFKVKSKRIKLKKRVTSVVISKINWFQNKKQWEKIQKVSYNLWKKKKMTRLEIKNLGYLLNTRTLIEN